MRVGVKVGQEEGKEWERGLLCKIRKCFIKKILIKKAEKNKKFKEDTKTKINEIRSKNVKRVNA